MRNSKYTRLRALSEARGKAHGAACSSESPAGVRLCQTATFDLPSGVPFVITSRAFVPCAFGASVASSLMALKQAVKENKSRAFIAERSEGTLYFSTRPVSLQHKTKLPKAETVRGTTPVPLVRGSF